MGSPGNRGGKVRTGLKDNLYEREEELLVRFSPGTLFNTTQNPAFGSKYNEIKSRSMYSNKFK